MPQDALANGDVDYAIAWVPKVLGSIEQGANLTEIAQIFQKSGTLQVSWADSGIDSVADFEGKKIGCVGLRQRVGDLRGHGRRGTRRHRPCRSSRRTST